MRITYATHNPAKLQTIRDCLRGLCDVEGLDGQLSLMDVEETGVNPLENARLKAIGFYMAHETPLLALDSGLYIDGLPPEEQPGVHVRRVGERRLTDDEMIEHYAGIARKLGGRATAQYRNGVCVIAGRYHTYETMAPEFGTNPFYIVDTPHKKRVEGYPLDSISVEIESGAYYYDLKERNPGDAQRTQAYRDFVCRALCGLDEAALSGAKACAARYMGGDATGHDTFHARRVMENALRIAYTLEGADLRVVTLAALLHDIDDGKLTGSGKRGETARARAYLTEEGYDAATASAVCGAIETVSFKGAGVATPVTSPEGAAVQDADRLDAIGAVGIGRVFAYGGAHGRAMYDPGEIPNPHGDESAYLASRSGSIAHFYEKLLLLGERMQTDAGRRIARARTGFMQEYLARFFAEWDGRDAD